MKAVLLLGGAPPPGAAVAECTNARVYAADAGAEVALAWGVVPAAVVGDMDSVRPSTLDALAARGARVLRHPPAKRDTDARLALDLALAEGATEVVLLGGTGRRLDQTLANLHLLRRAAEAGARARAVEADARIWIAAPARPAEADLAKGAVFSVLPLADLVEGVTVAGAAWPLADAEMRAGDPYGVSNVAEGPVRVSCRSGVLAVVAPEPSPDAPRRL